MSKIGLALLLGVVMMAAAGGVATANTEPESHPEQGGPAVEPLGNSLLDESALYFVSYDGLPNVQSFQQSGILSHEGYQYAAWYTSDRSATIARRALPDGEWERLALPHQLTVDDSHNVISLGISPEDGRLHVAMDTHNNPVYYTKSEAGLVSDPAGQSWDASRFGPIQRTLDGVDIGDMTYPRFLVTPDQKLQFVYRTGGSGDGTNELAEYSDGSWTTLGQWSSATGSYTADNGVTSTTRNMYVHGLSYDQNGRLHAAFTWREGNQDVLCAPGGLTNHDTGYVYSDDHGRTWQNSAGEQVGSTGEQPIAVDAPGHVVDPLGVDHGLMNDEGQAVDSEGQPHVIISYVPGRFTQCVTDYGADRAAYARPFHVYRDASGTWHKVELPEPVGGRVARSELVFDANDNAYVVMARGRILAASKASDWTDWTMLYDGSELSAFNGDTLVDDVRVTEEGVLSIVYQESSSGTTPSALRVADFRLGSGE